MATETFEKEPFFTWEAFWLGGCSIIVCLATWAFTDKSASIYTMSQLAFGLAFVVNHPHFLSSYNLLYGDFRQKILQRPRFFWAGVIVPILLGSGLAYSIASEQAVVMSYIVNAMFLLVGWHYTKQVFGCVIVTSARRKMYFSPYERRLLLFNLMSLWALSWFRSQAGQQSYDFYGIRYSSFNLPSQLIDYSYYAILFSGILLLWAGIQKYIQEGRVLNSSALMAFASLYVWYLPTFSHPSFAYLIPLFHSLQYMVFVWSFKTNQVTHQIQKLKGVEQRRAWVQQFVGFMFTAFVLGALSFEIIPKWLDSQTLVSQAAMGTTPFLAAFLLFINIHHYFIDNVIWRSTNEEVKAHLFSANAPSTLPYKKSA